jgi:hypothetical protein
VYSTVIGLASCTIAGALNAQNADPKQEDLVTFQLLIPERARFTETRTLRKAVDVGDSSSTGIQKFSQTSDVLIRRTGTGFSVTVKPRLTNQSEPVGSAAQGIAAALRGLQLRYEFDGQGNLLALHGLEPLREEVSSSIPPEMQPMLDAMLPNIIEQLKDDWRSRYRGLAGQTFRVGYRQTGEIPLTLMPGVPPVTATIARGVRSRLSCDGHECVVFFMGYVVDRADGYGEAVSRLMSDWLRQMLTGLAGSEAKPAIREMMAELPRMTVKEMVNVTERIVDPQTMTVYLETQTKGFRAVVDTAQEIHWTEVTELRYERVN